MKPPPPLGAAVPIYDTNEFLHRPAIPRRKSERIPTRGPIADRREYVVVLSFVSLRPAENASTVCGGTMQPSAWGGCGLPLSGRSRRANLLQSLVLAESECESVGNILNVYPEASRTSDWASPARSGFTTFCHRKVAPKVSAGHLCRDRTEVLTERAQKTALLRRKRLHRFDCGGSAKSASGLCTRLLPVVLHARSGRSNLRPICFLLRCNAESMVRSAQHDLFRCNSSILNLAGLRPAGSHREKSGSSDDTCAESERRVKFC